MTSCRGRVEITPRGSQPATTAAGVWRCGLAALRSASRIDPGPIGGSDRSSLNTAPPERSASADGRPSASVTPSKVSPAEWATMNQGGTPDAQSAPIIDPADVPTTWSALAGSQPVSRASASRPPVSHAPPSTPPAPSTSPTLMPPSFIRRILPYRGRSRRVPRPLTDSSRAGYACFRAAGDPAPCAGPSPRSRAFIARPPLHEARARAGTSPSVTGRQDDYASGVRKYQRELDGPVFVSRPAYPFWRSSRAPVEQAFS